LALIFLVKLPLYGLHIWLPKAHVEAPTVGSVLLAGLLLKMGGWGIYRLSAAGDGLHRGGVLILCFAGIVLGGVAACSQRDGKGLVAYSSVGHMNFFCAVGLEASSFGKGLGILMMLSHSLVSCLLFFIMGLVAHGAGSRVLFYGGVLLCASRSLRIGTWIGAFANFGTPPSIGYFSEVGYLIVVVGALRGV